MLIYLKNAKTVRDISFLMENWLISISLFYHIKHVNRRLIYVLQKRIFQMEETLIYGLSLLREHYYLLLFGVSSAPHNRGVKCLYHPSVISFCRQT